MSRKSGAFASLIRGVSEQVPHDRLPGQFWIQDNMISDPVRGLARRRGSKMLAEVNSTAVLDAATAADLGNYREQSFSIQGVDYSLAHRYVAKPAGSSAPALVCVNKSAGQILPVAVDPADTLTASVLAGGISAVTNVGDFVLLSAKDTATTVSTSDLVASTGRSSVVWIKGGDYSRTYTITLYNTTTGAVLPVTYKTPSSNYEGVLDTSDIPYNADDYTKRVNDRTHAYNTAVNQWIASAKAAIAPDAIAERLRALLAYVGANVTRVGAHLFIQDMDVVTAEDNGNGEFIKAISRDVESTADLSQYHLVGKVVKVTPKQEAFNNAAYYLRARAQVPGRTGFQEVIWEETAGVRITPGFVFLLGVIRSGTLYVASSASLLNALAGITNTPTFPASVAGDSLSQPVPEFFGKKISHMQTFQDRLMIVAGATVFMSRSGDYFNFFRETALSVLPNDPVEVFALGSEGDTITSGLQIDRGLLLFGKRHQYAIPAREAITPENAFIGIQGSYENAQECAPIASGSKGFFAQQREERLTLQQLQPGAYADNLQPDDVSKQLDKFLSGEPRQLVALTSPDMVFVRTSALTNGVFVYAYLDSSSQGRLFDSWSRWTWAPELGTLVAITEHRGSLLALYARDSGAGVKLVLDRFSRDSDTTDYPYLDSRRPASTPGSLPLTGPAASALAVAINSGGGDLQWLGTDAAGYPAFAAQFPAAVPHMELGTQFRAVVAPTAPYARDQQDRAILDSRLTLTSYKVTVSSSAAMRAYLSNLRGPANREKVLDWIFRPANAWVLNTQQVADSFSLTVFVMREVRDVLVELEARSWLPLTISSIEWNGQFFTSRR